MVSTLLWASGQHGNTSAFGSHRQVLSINGDAQNTVRVTFQAGSTGDLFLLTAGIGIWSGTASDTTATPLELTFNNGQHGCHAPVNTTITSDWVNLTGFTASDRLVVIEDMLDSGGGGNGIIAFGDGCHASDFFYDNTNASAQSYNLAVPGAAWTGPFNNAPNGYNLGVIEIEVDGGTGPATIAQARITNGASSNSGSIRQIVPLSAGGGDHIRVTFSDTQGVSPAILDHVSVGVWDGSAADCTATPVELLFNGTSGVTLGNNMTLSDWLAFTVPASGSLVVIMDINVTLGGIGLTTGLPSPSGYETFYNNTPGAASYNSATTPVGYTGFPNDVFFTALIQQEVTTPPPPTPPPPGEDEVATVQLAVPTEWPFPSPVVPARLTATGQAYIPDANGQVTAEDQDVPTLLSFGFSLITTKIVPDTAYTLVAEDNGCTISFTATTAIAVTVPLGLWTENFRASLIQATLSGNPTVSGGSGAQVANKTGSLSPSLGGQWSVANLYAVPGMPDFWILTGDAS